MIHGIQSGSVGGDGRSTKRRVSLLLLLALLPMFTGCKTWSMEERMPPDQFLTATALDPTENRIVGVTTTDGENVTFGLDPEADMRGDTIYAFTAGGGPYQVALSDVERVWVSWHETDTQKTVLAVVGIAAAVALVAGLIVAATKESCPFIYSW